MTWWFWLLLGLVLLAAEALTPGGFVLLLFGVAAVLLGFVAAAEVVTVAWGQWLLFGVASIGLLVGVRLPLLRHLRPAFPKDVDSITGETAFALSDIAINAFGKAELRGTTWTARNVGASPVTVNERCRVQRVDGLTLYISKE
jgi:inner membrane protein